ncbi:hypothetical protein [Paractinoplanes atraurantiacus]|uniref:hypothetical protein n=1 Tax=Paractinoplanes atraurantiacus TaxID=1036182 RepID=UPI00117893F8|nr:hypothetical protein [Actinoplanes atraurantiacus]
MVLYLASDGAANPAIMDDWAAPGACFLIGSISGGRSRLGFLRDFRRHAAAAACRDVGENRHQYWISTGGSSEACSLSVQTLMKRRRRACADLADVSALDQVQNARDEISYHRIKEGVR